MGAALDSGDIAWFSSHGPTADGRLAPQVVATGVRIHSARGGGSRGEYVAFNGTSMASPTVAGVAALLMDAAPEHREHPALARARLMAGAIRPDVWLDASDAFPSTNTGGPGPLQAQYGLGKVSARTSVLNRDETGGWIGGGAVSELQQGEYAYRDIEVPAGASRLDLVMTWDEPPADTIASTVLNDLDLWLDRDGDCGEGAVRRAGLRFPRGQRGVDHPEESPAGHVSGEGGGPAGLHSTAQGGTGVDGDPGRIHPEPEGRTDRTLLVGEGEQELTVTVTADQYVAAGSRLHLDCRDAGEASGCEQIRIHSMEVSREDGVSVDLSDDVDPPIPLGSSIPLGEIATGETQEVSFVISSPGASDPIRLYFTASAWNAKGASVSVEVGSDGTGQSETAQRPAHDDFAAAAVIRGEQGSHRLDLLLATPEPGEPLFMPRDGRPAGSVWYRWTAPANGPVRFEIPGPGGGAGARNDRIDVFRGDRISALERVASDQWGAMFFAEKGQAYRVRVSNFQRASALNLQWSQASRPVNDDFAHATLLEGADGNVEGTSRGATLEPGEWFGSAAGTTWYRWTAPNDGRWTFASEYPSRVLGIRGGRHCLTPAGFWQYPSSNTAFATGQWRRIPYRRRRAGRQFAQWPVQTVVVCLGRRLFPPQRRYRGRRENRQCATVATPYRRR